MRTMIALALATGCHAPSLPPPAVPGPPPSDEPLELPPQECDADAPLTLWLSPDDSNSMSSAVQAREAVLEGWAELDYVPLRAWEFLNYYTFDYPAADPGELRIALDLVQDDDDGWTLQIGVASPPPTVDPMNLALVIDTSCSMNGDPLVTAADVGRAIAGELRSGDTVSVLTWADAQQVVLDRHEVAGPDDPDLLAVLDDLRSDGGTDLSAGLVRGYGLLEAGFAADRVNRLILISDGGANLGETDEDVIGAHAGAEDEAGIYLVGVGVGAAAGYNDLLMDTVTDLGKGASVFVPDRSEADRMFGDRFPSTVGVAARDVQVRLDLPPGFELVQTSAEEVSTDPEEVRPQHVSPGDAMVLHQTLASACGDIAPDATVGVTVTWLDPVTFASRDASVTATVAELLAQDHGLLKKGAAVVAYVDALKSTRTTDTVATTLPTDPGGAALTAVSEALAVRPGDPDLLEIQDALDRLFR